MTVPWELDASKIFNEAVLDQLPVGVVVLDESGRVVKYNRFEERLAQRRRQDVIGRSFFKEVAVCTNVPQVAGVFEQHIGDNSLAAEMEYQFALPFLPRPRDVKLRMQSFRVEQSNYAVILIEDITLQKELERERKRLISIMMHDLNNPLSGILGYISLIEMGAIGPLEERHEAAIRSIGEAANRMKSLIAGTLSELNGRERGRRPINLHAIVLSVIGNQLPVAQDRGLEIYYEGRVEAVRFPTRAVVITGYVEQISSLIQNLLSNALKYAEKRVHLALKSEDEQVLLEVCDDGPGIAPEHRLTIFEENTQIPGSKAGLGIGLFSVKRAAENHGGYVEVESSPGAGATFRVLLPVNVP